MCRGCAGGGVAEHWHGDAGDVAPVSDADVAGRPRAASILREIERCLSAVNTEHELLMQAKEAVGDNWEIFSCFGVRADGNEDWRGKMNSSQNAARADENGEPHQAA